jgi:sec-independent protein translocase protein TatC
MSFMDHLEELRWSIGRSLLGIMVVAIVLFLNKHFLFDTLILGPMHADFPTYRVMCKFGRLVGMGDSACINGIHFNLISVEFTSQFMTQMQAAFTVGLIVVFPYVFWELWRFISPALYEKERKSVRGVVFVGSALFYIGLVFGYYVMAPLTLMFLGQYKVSDIVVNTFSLDSYMSTVGSLSLITGLIFEFPLVIFFLAKLGIVSPKFLRTYRKHAIVASIFLAAIISPSPDVFSCTAITVPIYGLYEVGIFAAVIVERARKKKERENS